jgi:hypothetical protein
VASKGMGMTVMDNIITLTLTDGGEGKAVAVGNEGDGQARMRTRRCRDMISLVGRTGLVGRGREQEGHSKGRKQAHKERRL